MQYNFHNNTELDTCSIASAGGAPPCFNVQTL